jgi:2-polyprenyl-3-methyl-5-hydroxy-6-metoxy-1,4-benzoquinol methylase
LVSNAQSSGQAGPSPIQVRRAGWRWKLAQQLEALWWKRYLRGADPLRYRAWKKAYWLELLGPHRGALGLERRQDAGAGGQTLRPRILDAGCGPAGINLALADTEGESGMPALHLTALDPLMNHYRQKLPAWPVLQTPGVHYLHQKLEEHQPEQPYDGLCCLNAINHVDDLDAALDALTQSIRPGGWLLLGVDAHRSVALQRLFRLIPGDALHPHQHTASEYQAMLQNRGWLVEDLRVHKPGRVFDYVVIRARK